MKNKKVVLTIVVAAIFIKLFLFTVSTIHAPGRRIDPDSVGYLNIASLLSSQGVFSEQDAKGVAEPELLRTPGYPLFLATLHEWLKLPLAAVVFIQILLTLFSAWLVSKTAVLIDPSVALLSGLIILYDPTITVVSLRILTDTLFLFLLSAFLFAITGYLKDGKMRMLLVAALLLVTATYIRPISYYLGGVTVVFMLYANIPRNYKRVVLHAVIFLTVVYGLLGLWQLRNYRCCGETDFATIARSNFGGYGLFHKYFTWNQSSLAGNIASVAWGILVTGKLLLNFLLCSVSFKYLGWYPLQIAGRILSYPWTFFWLPGFLAGLYKTRKNVLCQFLLLVLLYFSVGTVVNLSDFLEARLKIPIVPCLAIFSACGWSFLWPKIMTWLPKRAKKNP